MGIPLDITTAISKVVSYFFWRSPIFFYHWYLDGRRAKGIDMSVAINLLTALVNCATPYTVWRNALYPDLLTASP